MSPAEEGFRPVITPPEPRGTSPRSLLERYLSEKLVKEGLLTAEQLAEARAVQAERIVSLTAAITHLGLVDGARLRRLCSRLVGTPSVNPGDVRRAEPDALALLPREFAAEFQVIPFARRGETLFVATAEPWQLPVLAEIGARTGLRVAARFVEDAAIEGLLEVLYGIEQRRSQRPKARDALGPDDVVPPATPQPAAPAPAPVAVRRKETAPVPGKHAEASPRPAPPATAALPLIELTSSPPPEPAEETEELMSETTFAAIYQDAAWRVGASSLPPAGRQPAAEGAPSRELPPLGARPPGRPAPDEAALALFEDSAPAREAKRIAAPAREAAAPPAPAPPEPPPPPAPATPAAASDPPPGAAAAQRGSDEPPAEDLGASLEEGLGAPEALREIRPLASLGEARAALAATGDSRQLGWLLTRYALSKGRRVALFTRRGTLYVGWTAAGEGVDTPAVRELRVVPAPGSIFATVEATGAPFVGPLVEHPLHHALVAAFGGVYPRAVALFPVQHAGRVAVALYVDGGPSERLARDVADVALLLEGVSAVLERLARFARARSE
jgi:hypothetical protein